MSIPSAASSLARVSVLKSNDSIGLFQDSLRASHTVNIRLVLKPEQSNSLPARPGPEPAPKNRAKSHRPLHASDIDGMGMSD